MEIKSYILKNNFLEVKLLNLGACIKKIEIKDKNGILRNLVLSYENIEDYKKNPAYLGAIVGRTAGRIENGLLEIEENSYQLEKNNGNNNLHGGTNSISHKIWEVKNITDSSICFEIFSEHLENSFPANVNIRVQYTLKDNELLIKYFASADRKTYINLTNHSYFNLGNSKTIYEHSLNLNSDYMLELNSEFIPKKIKSLENSIFNFKNKGELRPSDCSPLSWGRSPQSPPKKEVLLKVEYNQNNKKLKEFFEKEKNNEQKKLVGNGIDHPFIIEKNKTFVKLEAEDTGISLEAITDNPAVVIYTGNFLADIGFENHSGICFETQEVPNLFSNKDLNIFPTFVDENKNYERYTKFIFKVN